MKHRIAVAFAVLALAVGSIAIAGPAQARHDTGWDIPKHGGHVVQKHDTGWDIP